jgi:IclR helix-turn-helix domain
MPFESGSDRPMNVAADRVLMVLCLDKSVVYRILHTLAEHRFVERNPKTRRYRVRWRAGRGTRSITASTCPARRELEPRYGTEIAPRSPACRWPFHAAQLCRAPGDLAG